MYCKPLTEQVVVKLTANESVHGWHSVLDPSGAAGHSPTSIAASGFRDFKHCVENFFKKWHFFVLAFKAIPSDLAIAQHSLNLC